VTGTCSTAGNSTASGIGLARLVTCEHGGNRIPPPYRHFFRDCNALLESHRGYDPGALGMARVLARALGAALIVSTTSRLLVELNRSPGRQFRESPVMRDAPASVRTQVTLDWYQPYRSEVETFVRDACANGQRVLHVSSHSFTPTLEGVERKTDVGLLYDPSRNGERALCLRWQQVLQEAVPGLVVRRNYPYLGRSDGLTSSLRKRLGDGAYCGVEIEVNQKHVVAGRFPARLQTAVAHTLARVLQGGMEFGA
jgi:predicted N-formylglutamate amidohydrolase